MVNRFLEMAKERKALRADVDALGRRIQALKRAPADEATNKDIKRLTNAGTRRSAGGAPQAERRETFNFLTDEGLLPNYAFPEAGVTLKSVIYRSREQEEEEAGPEPEHGDERNVYEYVRPAASALSEFAPENEFYAGGNRVSVDRIDLRVSPIETWRLCPSCDHCARVDVKDDHVACPRCGDVMWSDCRPAPRDAAAADGARRDARTGAPASWTSATTGSRCSYASACRGLRAFGRQARLRA